MPSFEQALEIVLNSAKVMPSETVALEEALGRVLREDVKADCDMPPFDRSTKDGFACRRQDLARELEVIETIRAGFSPRKRIGPKQCAKIMTGAVVPAGADCVIMQEQTEPVGDGEIRFVGDHSPDNICRRGRDRKAGDIILKSGTVIKPSHIALLALAGCVMPVVSKRPRVGVIATGDELVDPSQVPGAAQIRNTNAFQLAAQVRSVGSSVTNYGIARDAAEDISRILCKALGENDVALTAGGVCVGEFDLVRKVMKGNGVELVFEKVGVKPGRPMAFGIRRQAFCFALPGNPVSAFVMFELMVRPFLYKMMGHTYRPATSRARLQGAIIREKGDGDTWVPVVFAEPATVAEVGYQGPQDINALCAADGLVCLPAGITELQGGADVIVRHI